MREMPLAFDKVSGYQHSKLQGKFDNLKARLAAVKARAEMQARHYNVNFREYGPASHVQTCLLDLQTFSCAYMSEDFSADRLFFQICKADDAIMV